MSASTLIQGLSLDLQSINDLAFDEDCELVLQLGRFNIPSDPVHRTKPL